MKAFGDATYRSQVRRLRKFATLALKKYNIKVKKIVFINHGENTTFRVDAQDGSQYLLRIHRNGYHTEEAIHEEINWLHRLAKDSILSIPRPLKSKSGRLVEKLSIEEVGTRNFCVFKWIHGRFLEKSLKSWHMYQLGRIISKLQKSAPRKTNRIYWDAEGLVGKKAKFGSLDSIEFKKPHIRKLVLSARDKVYRKLKNYERKYPHRLGLIHADLHFGNLLMVGKEIGAIDFDDCGYGFHVYDLVIPIISAENIFGLKNEKMIQELKESLIEGYKTNLPWTPAEDEIFDYLYTARRLSMLAWMHTRSDNPRIRNRIDKFLNLTVSHIENARHL